ncbi:MAG: outer membrane protein transport protein [Cocleimonas sp.]
MQRALKPSLIAASILLAVTTQQASATNGYASHGFGMTQKAMGGTAVAGNDNAMNIATNPASMSFGKNSWTAGMDIFVPDRGFSHSGRPGHPDIPLGAFFPPGTPLPPGAVVPADNGIAAANLRGNDDGNFPIPEFAYQKHLNSKFAVGVAAYGNGGMNATYDRPIFAGPGSKNTGIDFSQLFIAPSVSMKVGEGSSIGASLNLVYQRFRTNGVSAFAPFSRDPSKLSDNDYDSSTGAGISIGWQTQFSDSMTFGAAYRSKTKMSKFDKYAGLFAEQGDFDIPSMFTIGLSVQATPKTTLAFDVAHIKYTGVKSISNKNNTGGLQQQLVGQAFGLIPPGTPLQGALLGDENGAGFGWDDQTILKLGVKHQLNNKIALMAGWNHAKAPIENDQTAFNVLAPATVEDHLTLGMEYALSKNSNLTFSYMHAFENTIKGDASRAPSGAPNSPGAQIGIGGNPLTDFTAADLDMTQNSFGIAYTKNF